jgi:hypothetical protein
LRLQNEWWKDWLTDPALSVCSLAAQGLWMRMLCIMSMSDPLGHLILPPARAVSTEAKQIARMCLADARQVRMLLGELEIRGVFSRNDAGVIVSRRMIREGELSERGRSAAVKSWANRKGQPKGQPNAGNGSGQVKGSHEREPLPRTDADTDSPPMRSPNLKPRRRKQATPTFRNGMAESVAADMQESDDHAKAERPRPGGAAVVPISRRLVRH